MAAKEKFTMVPIKRTDVFQTIVQQLNHFIYSGDLKTGQRLPSERELAESLGVSRTSIRQALKVIEASGKIETRVGSGTFITGQQPAQETPVAQSLLPSLLDMPVDVIFLRNLIAARSAIETAVFKEYSKQVTPEGIEMLKALLDENKAEFTQLTEDGDTAALDLSFEAKAAELLGNPVLLALQQQIHQLWTYAWNRYGYVPESCDTLHKEHLQILAALAEKSSSRVEKLITHHVNKSLD